MPSTPTKSRFPLEVANANHTPAHKKLGVSAPALLGDTNTGRDAVVGDLGKAVRQVPLDWFKRYILPPLPTRLSIPKVIKKLKKDKHITSDGVWSVFPDEPADSDGKENDVFSHFATVAAAVGKAAEGLVRGLTQNVSFHCKPHTVPQSVSRNNSAKPDGYGLFVKHDNFMGEESVKDPFWEFIVCPGEVKKSMAKSDAVDDNKKLTWSLNHVMREDQRRRFVVGYTIENVWMRIWFTSRTDALVTEPFDFRSDHKTTAHFFLSQMYAQAHELGYDTTMKPATDPLLRAKNQWDMIIHHVDHTARSNPIVREITFRTKELLSSIGAETIQSRGTRVWSGQLTVDQELLDNVVVKDYWVDDDRTREAVIRQKILEAVPQAKRANLERHLLTPLYWGDVQIDCKRGKKVERVDDHTGTLLRRGGVVPNDLEPFVLEDPSLPKPVKDGSLLPQGSGVAFSESEAINLKKPAPILHHDKSHHRVAFKECAKTSEELTTVYSVLCAATHTLGALSIIHEGGWVHRDVSVGNIFIVGDIAKIGDLEYAKSMYDVTTHSGRSGTAFFMSVEAEHHGYRFMDIGTIPSPVAGNQPAVDILDAFSKRKKKGDHNLPAEESAKTDATQVAFRYNPLHDIESLLWVMVYLLLYRSPKLPGDTQKRIEEQRAFYGQFFINSTMRMSALMSDGVLSGHGGRLHPKLVPVANALERWRKLLVQRYKAAEADVTTIDHHVAVPMINPLWEEINKVLDIYEQEDVELIPNDYSYHYQDKGPEPAAAAAVMVGPSLDSRTAVMEKRKRGHSDTLSPIASGSNFVDVLETERKRVKKDKPTETTTNGSGDGTGAGDEETSTADKGKGKAKATSRTRSRSSTRSRPVTRSTSGSSEGRVTRSTSRQQQQQQAIPLRRSQRNLKKK